MGTYDCTFKTILKLCDNRAVSQQSDDKRVYYVSYVANGGESVLKKPWHKNATIAFSKQK